VGHIERTLFALDWITGRDLRQTTTAELDKGEARNKRACGQPSSPLK